MSFLKNVLQFLVRRVLRIDLPKNRLREPGRAVPAEDRPAIKTLRTYPPGGDPFDDMIEFSLKEGGTAPSGFRMPPGEQGDS